MSGVYRPSIGDALASATAQCDNGRSLVSQSGKTRSSWLRDSMPSLMNTFFR
jgi:hypothetical protein